MRLEEFSCRELRKILDDFIKNDSQIVSINWSNEEQLRLRARENRVLVSDKQDCQLPETNY